MYQKVGVVWGSTSWTTPKSCLFFFLSLRRGMLLIRVTWSSLEWVDNRMFRIKWPPTTNLLERTVRGSLMYQKVGVVWGSTSWTTPKSCLFFSSQPEAVDAFNEGTMVLIRMGGQQNVSDKMATNYQLIGKNSAGEFDVPEGWSRVGIF